MRNILYLLIGFMFVACFPRSRKEAVTAPVISINADRKEVLTLFDYFSEILYLPLSDSLLVGTIERVKVYGGKLFILSNTSF